VRITPLDVRNHPFRRRFSGYDRDEVDAFLRMVAEDYEAAVRETDGLREQATKLEQRITDLAANEAVLQDTLTTAQKLSEDLKRSAMKEAEIMIGEAEIRAEKIMAAAHRRGAELAADLREMKHLRTRLAADIRATIATHMGLLEGLVADECEPVASKRELRGPNGEPSNTVSRGES